MDGAPVALPEENATVPAAQARRLCDHHERSPRGRPTVAELMADELLAHPGLFPVGRLNTDTTGFCCSPTTDSWAMAFCTRGAMGEDVSGPGGRVPDAGDVRRLRRGLLDDGPTLPAARAVLEGADACRAAQLIGEGPGQRVPPAPQGQARPRRAGRRGIYDGSAPARGAATAKCVACWKP